MRINTSRVCRRSFLVLALLLTAVPTRADDSPISRATLAGIASCHVLVEKIERDAEHDGLVASQIHTDVEFRLHQAGIRVDPSSDFTLYVNINTIKSSAGVYAYNIRVSLEQSVRPVHNTSIITIASTWSLGTLGVIDAARLRDIRAVVLDHVEAFVTAHLEANRNR